MRNFQIIFAGLVGVVFGLVILILGVNDSPLVEDAFVRGPALIACGVGMLLTAVRNLA